MKMIRTLACLVGAISLGACTGDPEARVEADGAAELPPLPDDPEDGADDLRHHVSVAKVFTLDPGGPHPYFFAGHRIKNAWSRFTRRARGVCMSIDTRRLEPGAYTVWFRVFDDPASCANPDPAGARCSRLDIPACQAAGTCSVLWVTGADTACAHGEHFTPLTGADVRFGPSGGVPVPLVEQAGGTYTATVPTVYAAAYQFSVDGEPFELVSPPSFSATIESMSATRAVIELSDASAPSLVVIRTPDGRRTAHTIVGSPAAIDADFSARGEYQIEMVRTLESAAGVVEIERRTTLNMP